MVYKREHDDGEKDRGIVIKVSTRMAHGWLRTIGFDNQPNAVAFRQRHRIDCLDRLYHNSTTSGLNYRGGWKRPPDHKC